MRGQPHSLEAGDMLLATLDKKLDELEKNIKRKLGHEWHLLRER